MQAPCKNCEDRNVGCHSKCEKYLAYAEYQKGVRQRRFAAGQIDTAIINNVYKTKRRIAE